MNDDDRDETSAGCAVKLTDTSRPIDAGVKVQSARAEYLAENGFSVAEYTSPTVRLKFFGRYFDFPNSPSRQWAIPLHDLHHIATGYGTDWVGEAEVGVWELRAGCETPVVYFLNGAAVLIGLCLSPSRMLAAYRAAKGARTLYRAPVPMEQVLAMRVGELRSHLGVPAEGLATERRLHEDARRSREQQLAATGAGARETGGLRQASADEPPRSRPFANLTARA